MGKIKHGRKILLILSVFFILGWGCKVGGCPVSAVEIGQETAGNNENPTGAGSEVSDDETDSWDPEEDETDRSISSEEEQESDTDSGKKSKKKQKTTSKSSGKKKNTKQNSGKKSTAKQATSKNSSKKSTGKSGKQAAKGSNKNNFLPAAKKLSLEQIEEETYLIDEDGEPQSGWFLRSGEDYWKLGNIQDIGLYKNKKFCILYANGKGKIPKDSEICGVPFDSEGLPSEAQGIYRIRGKYYLILQGRLQTTDITWKKDKYYINLDGTVAYYSRRSKYFQPSGKKMSSLKSSEARTRQQARKVIRVITKKSMTRKQKLETCFQWVVDHYGYYEKTCNGKKGWTSVSGYQLLRHGSGDCRVLAAGFAFLASELGYQDVAICQDSVNRFSGCHCWAQVDGKCFDPLFYNSNRPRRRMAVFCGSTPEQYRSKTHCIANQKFRPGA